MNNALTPFARGALSTVFGPPPEKDDLSSGIAAGYSVISVKGKVWTVKYRGGEEKLMRPDGSGPVNGIEVVIIGASKYVAKTFYAAGYTEGGAERPDCYSNNGVAPEPDSPSLQSQTCAACPRNVWGSKSSEVTGKPGKQCQDNKRIAIVPLQDIPCKIFGGGMLLRVPPASLQELAQFGQKMHQMGYPYYTFGTRISFDVNEAFPKLVFNEIRPLTDDEAQQVLQVKDSELVARILSESGSAFTPAAPATSAPSQQAQEGVTWPTSPAAPAQSSPSTGTASTTSAQPAAQTAQAPTTAPTGPSQAAPASASQPTPAKPIPAGGATTAFTGQTQGSGFSSPTPATNPNPTNGDARTIDLKAEPKPSSTPQATEGQTSEFEAGLDALMGRLLPKTS